MSRQPRVNMETFDRGLAALPNALKEMGYKSFRPGQDAPVKTLLRGFDVLAILPTGAGKTLIHASVTKALGHKTIVFSPLVALMQDQVQSLNRRGLRTAAVSSAQSEVLNTSALQQWMTEQLDVLFVAPERMENQQFIAAMDSLPPSFVVVDECHTVSKDAHVFRPAYMKVGDFIEQYNPDIVLAITATATQRIVDDVKRILGIDNCIVCKHLVPRNNISLHSVNLRDDGDLFGAVCRKVKSIEGSVIVYCATTKTVEDMAKYLDSANVSVTFYHGQLQPPEMKISNQEEFMSGRKRVMVATNAFGMGIDKPDIRGIIHANPPGSIEAISQETGRAARDGKPAECWMFNTPAGMRMQRHLFAASNPKGWEVEKMYKYLCSVADRNNDVRETIESISLKLDMEAAQGAINMLVNAGCIERNKPEKDIRTFLINPDPETELTNATQKLVIEGIREGGARSADSNIGWETWDVDIAYVVKHVGKLQPTVMSHVRQLRKDGYLQDMPKFKGKVTHIVKPPAKEVLKEADERWDAERRKMDDVIVYIDTPDEKKQDFITHYFDLDSEKEKTKK